MLEGSAMALGQNLRRLRQARNLTQTQLSDRTGGLVSQGAIAALEKRDSTSSNFATALATALGVSINELLGAESPQNVVAKHADDAVAADEVQIPEYRLSFAAGPGCYPEYELVEEKEPATYRLSWFQSQRINPKNARRFSVSGDSMIPTLYHGDTVLVNLEESDPTRLIDGRVYAIRYGDELRIKRLYRKLDGTLTLRSDNPEFKDEDVPAKLAEEHISIIGRVRDKSGQGGL